MLWKSYSTRKGDNRIGNSIIFAMPYDVFFRCTIVIFPYPIVMKRGLYDLPELFTLNAVALQSPTPSFEFSESLSSLNTEGLCIILWLVLFF